MQRTETHRRADTGLRKVIRSADLFRDTEIAQLNQSIFDENVLCFYSARIGSEGATVVATMSDTVVNYRMRHAAAPYALLYTTDSNHDAEYSVRAYS